METVKVQVLQSFVKDGKGGNAAGVVADAEHLSERQMQDVAKKAGYSETAFVHPSDSADVSVRFFTPNEEVDLCGHATVATFTLLRAMNKIRGRLLRQETKAGILDVELRDDGTVFYDQTLPVFGEYIAIPAVAAALQIPSQWIEETHFRPQIVSTGMRDILVGISSRVQLLGLTPDFARVKTLSGENNTIGIHVFTLDTIHPESMAHSRNFAPLFGIDEEAATGSSNGALACYLWENSKISSDRKHAIIFEQGYGMQSPSEIVASLGIEDNKITKVQAGGKAVRTGEIEVDLSR